MKLFNRSLALFLAVIAFSLVSVIAQNVSDNKTTAALEQQIFKKILRLPYYEVFDHIGYTVNGDTVVLSGKVHNGINKSGAENAVEDIAGVNRVVNNIEILPPSPFDDGIRRNLYRDLSNMAGLSSYLWHVNPSVRLIVENGHITLEGHVRNRGDYNLMYIVARGIPNSFSVTNNLVIEKDSPR
jgi:hyperosmotically inducible protein